MSIYKPMLGEQPDWTRFPRPVSMWVMNEGCGNKIYDLSGNSNDLAFYGSPEWRAGSIGSAVYLNGGAEWLRRLGSIVTSEPFTIVADWITSTDIQDDIVVAISNVAITDDYWALRYGFATSVVRFDVRTTAGGISSTPGVAVAPGQRVWAAAVAESSASRKIYVDGVYRGIDTTDRTPVVDAFIVGNQRYNANYYSFEGRINAVMLFPFALTAQQIQQLYIDPFPWFQREPAIKLWTPPEDGGIVVLRRRRECA